MDVPKTLNRLLDRLPLVRRQRALPRAALDTHRSILRSFRDVGRPPSPAEIGAAPSLDDPRVALAALEADDLITRGPDGRVTGAYPFTTAKTPHALIVGGRRIHAMCAVDALAVAPLFDTRVVVDSSCEVTGSAVHTVQNGREITEASPPDLHVGIRWQTGGGAAADTL